MVEKYTDRVEAYCEEMGISIPPGFYRHPASRYVAIDVGTTPPKLVAKTWFKQEDVVYFLSHLPPDRKIRLLDFKERLELQHAGGNRLRTGEAF